MSDEQPNSQIGGIAADALRQFIDRIERLEEEKKALAADITDVFAQCKSQGFDTKIVRKILTLRKRDRAEREEEDQILDLYLDEHGHPCLGCRDADRFAPSCPGEAGEVVDYTAWAEDTMAACAEAKYVL